MAQHLGLGGAAALDGGEAAAALRGRGGMARVFGGERGAARGLGAAAQGVSAPLPSPPYIGARPARVRVGASRPPPFFS